jgi:predicted O-linked N-acetylglucosamine transferase (SPINDLY family)
MVPSSIETAIQLHRAGRLADADDIYQRILAVNATDFDAAHLSGLVALQQGNLKRAIELCSRAVELNGSAPPAIYHLGAALRASQRLDEARASFERALELKPDYPEALNELGIVHQLQRDCALARECFERAVELKPDLAEAHCNLGAVLKEMNEPERAIDSFKLAISIDPEFAEAHFLLAKTYQQRGMLAEALAGYQETLQYKPDLAEAHFNLGHILHDQAFDEDALKCFQAALDCQPDFVEAKWAIAMSQLTLVYGEGEDPQRFRDAFSQALDDLGRWFDDSRLHLGYMAVGSQQPFYIAYQEVNNRPVLSKYGDLCARLMRNWYSSRRVEPVVSAGCRSPIAVGIVSAHIRDHSVWTALIRGWVDRLNRDEVSISLFHLGAAEDAETERARDNVSTFIHGLPSLEDWTNAIAGYKLDMLIFPEIGMDPITLKLAAIRLAPIQVAAWGHPETTGLPTIDYYLSAKDFEPANAADNYRETLITLPNLGCYYEPLQVPSMVVNLEELGIDSREPILICPGTPYKYSPHHDQALIDIAAGLGGCQLIFFEHNQGNLSQKLQARLEASFDQRGLDFHRYAVFVPWLNRPAFYGLLRQANLFLDTMGFSGFNTAMQAVECGLPIVAYEGRFMRGRLASGILKRMGIEELVATSDLEYARIAIEVARNDVYQTAIRERILASRHLLFNDMAPIHALNAFICDASNAKSQRRGSPLA